LKAVCAVSSAAAEADPSFTIPTGASCVKETTTKAAAVATTLAPGLVGTTNQPPATVTGKVVIKGEFGTPPPPARVLDAPVGKSMADNLKMSQSLVATTCSWVASTGRRLETSRSLTAAQDLQADYVITVPAGYTSTAGNTLDASGVGTLVEALGSNAPFTADLKTNAAAAGPVINVTGVTATATVTQPTGPVAQPGPAPAPAAAAEESSSNTGAIIGGILGAIFGISLIGVCVFCIIKKRKNEQE
jgi:hypothetical protein